MFDPHPGVPDDAPTERPNLALQSLGAIAIGHTGGHRCDGEWFNDQTGTRTPCPTLRRLNVIRTQIERLLTQVHDAAHTPRHVDAVAQGMTGLVLADLHPDDADGWRQTARYAIEALSFSLENNDALTDRAAAAAARHT